jgi:type VI secretion system secreted protein Hcp
MEEIMIRTTIGRTLIAGIALLSASTLLPATANASMTAHITLTADGEDIEGESSVTTLDRENTIEAFRFNFEVLTGHGSFSGAPLGVRTYKPIVWVQRWDKSVPLLWKALTQNARIEATIKFYRPDPDGGGTTEQFFTIEVGGGKISRIRAVSPDARTGSGSEPPLMEVEVVFNNIIMTYEATGAAHEDSWQEEQ